jgi:WD40 repeat protein
VVPADGQIHLLSLQPGGQDRSIAIETAFSIDISRDGSLVAAGIHEEVRVFEVSSLRQVALLRGSLGAFNSVSFSPDHHRVVASDSVSTTWLWDLATRREVGRFGPKHRPGLVHARFQPNGDTMVIHRAGSRFDELELLRTPSWEAIEAAGKRTEGKRNN